MSSRRIYQARTSAQSIFPSSKASLHTNAFLAGGYVGGASWSKKSSFHFSVGLGWPYLCGKWYGSHLAYFFSLAWWEPYACYPWYAGWNPYPHWGASYWYAPWIYTPVAKPVYYCDYYAVPQVVHTTKVVHQVVHVPAKEDSESDLKQLTPAEQFQRLGDIHFREGRYEQAAIAYERAIRENPDHAALRFVLADARFAMGDFHGAAAAIRQGLAKDPRLANAKADKLAFYEKRETFERQLEALKVFAAEHPANADAHLVLGFNLLFAGDPSRAREAFAKALEIDPEDAAAALFLEAVKG